MNRRVVIIVVLALMATSIPTSLFALPTGYSVTRIDVAGGVQYARALNERGQVVGDTRSRQASLWDRGSAQVMSATSHGYGLNDLGQVVGSYNGHPAMWQDGVITDLSNYRRYGEAFDINNSGQITFREWLHPYMLSGDQVIDLDPAGLLSQYYGVYINNKGEVAMYRYDVGTAHAVFWRNGVRTDLYALGCYTVFGINDAGQVIGDLTSGQGYIWQNGTLRSLGDRTRAYGINQFGTVVGKYGVSGRACIWENGIQTDLNTLISPSIGITLLEAGEINSRGQIIADDSVNYYLLTPVPEPLGILPLLSGCGGFVLLASRKRRRRVW
jgi:uncharacterized membrane protein